MPNRTWVRSLIVRSSAGIGFAPGRNNSDAALGASIVGGMDTYRRLFAVPEFRALFAAQLAAACGMTMQGLALSVLVYDRTRSPLLAAVAISGVYVPQAIGVMTLSSAADRLPPRLLLTARTRC